MCTFNSAGTPSRFGGFICACLLLSRNTVRAFSTYLSSFSPPPSGRVLLCDPFAPYLRFSSFEALGESGFFARSFLLFALSAPATAKQALGQHLPASQQSLIVSRSGHCSRSAVYNLPLILCLNPPPDLALLVLSTSV